MAGRTAHFSRGPEHPPHTMNAPMEFPAATASWRDRDFAPSPGTELCAVEHVPDGGAREFNFGDGREPFRLIVLRSGGNVWGYLNKCPHFGVPLNVEPDRFTLFEHSYLYCSVHCAMFRFEDGFCEDGPCQGDSLLPVPLTIEQGRVRIATE
jgi:nitrite reductase/ring-hydroxylating ferredoxin subunit